MRIIKLTLLLMSGLMMANGYAETGTDGYQLLQKEWAIAKYQTPEDKREAAFKQLAKTSQQMVEAEPENAELLVWHAIVLSTYAGEKGGLGALSLVKEAKSLLERAQKINPQALNGSIYTSLGSLYYQVPGWPIGFGDDDLARENLQKALVLNPNGIDSNYFYGDFLVEEGEYKQAVAVLEKALNAPARDDRPLADAGRRKEVEAVLAKARKAL